MVGDLASDPPSSVCDVVVGSVGAALDLPPVDGVDLDEKTPYAHAGRRRKRITEDLFRCRLPLRIGGERIACNALVWRKSDKMREHLHEHFSEDDLFGLSETDIRGKYMDAARVPQEGIPNDEDE